MQSWPKLQLKQILLQIPLQRPGSSSPALPGDACRDPRVLYTSVSFPVLSGAPSGILDVCPPAAQGTCTHKYL